MFLEKSDIFGVISYIWQRNAQGCTRNKHKGIWKVTPSPCHWLKSHHEHLSFASGDLRPSVATLQPGPKARALSENPFVFLAVYSKVALRDAEEALITLLQRPSSIIDEPKPGSCGLPFSARCLSTFRGWHQPGPILPDQGGLASLPPHSLPFLIRQDWGFLGCHSSKNSHFHDWHQTHRFSLSWGEAWESGNSGAQRSLGRSALAVFKKNVCLNPLEMALKYWFLSSRSGGRA